MSIQFEHVTKTYSSLSVLSDLSFEIEDHTFYALLGPSGSGKTTLTRLLLGLEQPDSGKITNSFSSIHAVFQEDRLLENLSALENLQIITGKKNAAANEQLLLSLALPKDSLLKPVSDLSGGMRRRVTLARALSVSSDFLILDEPFKGLDDSTRLQVMEYTRKHCQKISLLLITHDNFEADYFTSNRLSIK